VHKKIAKIIFIVKFFNNFGTMKKLKLIELEMFSGELTAVEMNAVRGGSGGMGLAICCNSAAITEDFDATEEESNEE
jgi:hypothetical protein